MKKRLFSGLLALLMLLLPVTLAACKGDDGKTGTEGLAYEQIEGKKEYRVVGLGNATGTEIAIAEAHDGKPVTEIAEGAFRGCETLTKITIPQSIAAIGKGAFADCTGLLAVQLDARTLADLAAEDNIFENAGTATEGLELTVGADVRRIPNYLFASTEHAPKLTKIAFADKGSCLTVGKNAFSGCSALASVEFGEDCPIETLGASAFSGCTALAEITIPANMRIIGSAAFFGCSALKSINFDADAKLLKIEVYAFGTCTSLVNFTVPASANEIGASVFFGCTSLTTVEFESVRDWRAYSLTGDTVGTEIDVSSEGDNARRFTEPDKAYWAKTLKRQPAAES